MQNLADFLARSNGVKFYFIGDEDFQIQAETSIFHFKVILTFIVKYSTFMRGLMCFGSDQSTGIINVWGKYWREKFIFFFQMTPPWSWSTCSYEALQKSTTSKWSTVYRLHSGDFLDHIQVFKFDSNFPGKNGQMTVWPIHTSWARLTWKVCITLSTPQRHELTIELGKRKLFPRKYL